MSDEVTAAQEGSAPRRSATWIVANTGFFVHNFLMHFADHFAGTPTGVVIAAPPEPGLREKLTPHVLVPLRKLSRKGTHPLGELAFLLELATLYRRHRPARVCHFTVKPNIYGGILCGLLGIPSVSVVSGLGYLFLNRGFASFAGRLLYRVAFLFPRRVYFLNREDHDLFLAAGLVRPRQARLLPGTGVDATFFRPGAASPFPREPGKVVFLMIARVLWDKGVREYFEAAERVRALNPAAEFWLLGPLDAGNPSCVPEEYVRDFAGRGVVRHLGAVDDVRPYVAACDAAVLPSYREGVPRALLEPMAMGKPVICTDVPGCRDVVDPGVNGFLVPARDADALAEACARMAALAPEERGRMGAAGREKVLREFENRVVLERFVATL